MILKGSLIFAIFMPKSGFCMLGAAFEVRKAASSVGFARDRPGRPPSACQVVVVTDGSRILGLGDLGANGMGIPIGKLALYCAYGGIAPHRVLPVTLDLGTNNAELLSDPHYRGWRQPRVSGREYYELVDEFMKSVFARFPSALVQFEDFSSDKASALLSKYRDKYLCFNDDIQGTGATVLAGVLGALRMQRKKRCSSTQ